MKKKFLATLVALMMLPASPAEAVYSGQYCKERDLGNVQMKQKTRLPKPKYDTLQCQLVGKRYKWVKISK